MPHNPERNPQSATERLKCYLEALNQKVAAAEFPRGGNSGGTDGTQHDEGIARLIPQEQELENVIEDAQENLEHFRDETNPDNAYAAMLGELKIRIEQLKKRRKEIELALKSATKDPPGSESLRETVFLPPHQKAPPVKVRMNPHTNAIGVGIMGKQREV